MFVSLCVMRVCLCLCVCVCDEGVSVCLCLCDFTGVCMRGVCVN